MSNFMSNEDALQVFGTYAAASLKQYSISVPANAWSYNSTDGKYHASIYPASGYKFSSDSLIIVALAEDISDTTIDFAVEFRLRAIDINSNGSMELTVKAEPTTVIDLSIAANKVTEV